MSNTFRAWRLDETLLFPPSVQDFVPEDHLSRFVVSLVRESLNLKAIYAAYRGEKGQPPYDPAMMVALLLYSYDFLLFAEAADDHRPETARQAGRFSHVPGDCRGGPSQRS